MDGDKQTAPPKVYESSVDVCNIAVQYKECFDNHELAGQQLLPFEF